LAKSQGLIKGARAKRSVRFALVYTAGAWVVTQVGDVVFDAFGFPDWAMRLLIVALVLGAPVAILAGWFAGARSKSARAAEDMRGPDEKPSSTATAQSARATMPPVRTHYARSGAVSIAYQVVGEGPVDLVLTHGWVSNIESAWEYPRFAEFLSRLAGRVRLIHFDKRGTGLSDRVADLPDLEQRMDDVRAVMDAADSKRAILMGYSEGGPMCALFAATYPERTLGLIIYGSYAKRLRSEDYPWAPSEEERAQEIRKTEANWGQAGDVSHYAPSMAGDEAFRKWVASYFRLSASPKAAAELLAMNSTIDIRHVLPCIQVPTLILHRRGDRDANVEEGRYIASRIHNADFVELDGDDHLPWIGDTEALLRPIDSFVGQIGEPAAASAVLATLVAIHSDEGWDSTNGLSLAEYIETEATRLRSAHGTRAGRSIVRAFDGPVRAVRCALAIAGYARDYTIDCGIGVHVGECTVSERDLSGSAVDLCMQLAEQGSISAVLTTRTVADLVPRSRFDFSQREKSLCDAEGTEWPVFAVSPRGDRGQGSYLDGGEAVRDPTGSEDK